MHITTQRTPTAIWLLPVGLATMLTPALLSPRRKIPGNFPRKQIWSKSHGVAIADEMVPNVAELMRSGSAASIPLATQPKIRHAGKRYLSQGGVVLKFFGYFKEAVYESQIENYRIRQCEVNYFLEDDTISVCEQKVENSGVPQGTFAKRQRIALNEADEKFYELEDIKLGGTMEVYGRR